MRDPTAVAICVLLASATHARAQPPTAIAGYDRGLYLATGDDRFRLWLRGRLQVRWELAAQPDELVDRFTLPVARVTLDGHAFATTDYVISGEVGTGAFELRDAYIEQPLAGARLRLGQLKRPFSRQHMTSTAHLQLTERAITDGFVGAGRDNGVALLDAPARNENGLEWALGVFNGVGGTAAPAPTDSRPLVVARLGYASAHVDGEREGDFDGGPPRLAIAVGYMADLAEGTSSAMTHTTSADVVFKAYGFAATAAGYVLARPDPAGRSLDLGFHAQAGLMIVPDLVELAGRFAQIETGDRHQQEIRAAFNLFPQRYDLRWQLEAGGVRVTGVPGFDWTIRVQTQLAF